MFHAPVFSRHLPRKGTDVLPITFLFPSCCTKRVWHHKIFIVFRVSFISFYIKVFVQHLQDICKVVFAKHYSGNGQKVSCFFFSEFHIFLVGTWVRVCEMLSNRGFLFSCYRSLPVKTLPDT